MPLFSASLRAPASARVLKPMMTAFDAIARLTSLSVMPPTAACTTCTLTSSVDSLSSDCASASCEPCTSALMISDSVCAAPSPMFSNMFSSLAACRLFERDLAVLALAEGGDLACPALVGQHHELVAGLRHLGQALDLDRDRRAGLVDRLAVFVEHRAHAAVAGAGEHDVAALQRARLHQHGGDRAAALVELRLDHQALARHRIGGGLQLEHLGLQQHLLEQVVDALRRSWPTPARTANRRRTLRAPRSRPPARSSRARGWPRACRSC